MTITVTYVETENYTPREQAERNADGMVVRSGLKFWPDPCFAQWWDSNTQQRGRLTKTAACYALFDVPVLVNGTDAEKAAYHRLAENTAQIVRKLGYDVEIVTGDDWVIGKMGYQDGDYYGRKGYGFWNPAGVPEGQNYAFELQLKPEYSSDGIFTILNMLRFICREFYISDDQAETYQDYMINLAMHRSPNGHWPVMAGNGWNGMQYQTIDYAVHYSLFYTHMADTIPGTNKIVHTHREHRLGTTRMQSGIYQDAIDEFRQLCLDGKMGDIYDELPADVKARLIIYLAKAGVKGVIVNGNDYRKYQLIEEIAHLERAIAQYDRAVQAHEEQIARYDRMLAEQPAERDVIFLGA